MKTEITDSELRALLLSQLYETRRAPVDPVKDFVALIPDGSESEFHRIAGQLLESRLIEALERNAFSPGSRGYVKQYSRIRLTTSGINAVESGMSEKTPLDFSIVQNIVMVNQPSGPVHIGDNVTFMNLLNLLEQRIEESAAPAEEKKEVKNLLQRVAEHPLAVALISAAATKAMG